MTELYWQVTTPSMRQVLEVLGHSELCPHFYLAGGTALALQLGHRRSVDLDFFSETDEVRPEMHRHAARILAPFQPVIAEEDWGNLVFVIQGNLRVGFFAYGYRLLEPTLSEGGAPLASLLDIGLMKLDALATRAARKDFYDLYAIAQQIPLRRLLDRVAEKYPGFRDFEAMVVRRMVFFERAEQEAIPPLLQPIEWERVKAFFREQAVALARGWL